MSVQMLKLSYENATSKNGLIAFTREMRENNGIGKYSVTSQRLEALFSSKIWIPKHKPGGHLKYQHAITGTIVEYKNHGLSKGIDPGAAVSILESVQETLNVMCNEIFCYESNNWKKAPDYHAALNKLQSLGISV